MSQLLVGFFNNTDNKVLFVNLEDSSNNQTVGAKSMFQPKVPYNFPDSSNCLKSFPSHHMEIQYPDGQTLFSFWDDEDDNYNIYCCLSVNCNKSIYMPGYYNGGNNASVGIFLSSSGATYTIEAVPPNNKV